MFFLIEDLMLLCIQEQDVGYRPSIKTARPGPGSEAIDL